MVLDLRKKVLFAKSRTMTEATDFLVSAIEELVDENNGKLPSLKRVQEVTGLDKKECKALLDECKPLLKKRKQDPTPKGAAKAAPASSAPVSPDVLVEVQPTCPATPLCAQVPLDAAETQLDTPSTEAQAASSAAALSRTETKRLGSWPFACLCGIYEFFDQYLPISEQCFVCQVHRYLVAGPGVLAWAVWPRPATTAYRLGHGGVRRRTRESRRPVRTSRVLNCMFLLKLVGKFLRFACIPDCRLFFTHKRQ